MVITDFDYTINCNDNNLAIFYSNNSKAKAIWNLVAISSDYGEFCTCLEALPEIFEYLDALGMTYKEITDIYYSRNLGGSEAP